MKKMYIVTGADGHLGNTIVRMLANENCQVRGLILPGQEERELENVTYYKGDVREKESLLPLFEGLEGMQIYVIHTAGMIDISDEVTPLIYDVNVNGTKTVAGLCLEKHVKRLVYVSSVHAIPENGSFGVMQEVTDFSEKKVFGGYAKTKAEATRAVLDMVKQGLDAVIVHPSGILGPFGGTGNYLVQLVSDYIQGRLPACVKGGYDLWMCVMWQRAACWRRRKAERGNAIFFPTATTKSARCLPWLKKPVNAEASRCFPCGWRRRPPLCWRAMPDGKRNVRCTRFIHCIR